MCTVNSAEIELKLKLRTDKRMLLSFQISIIVRDPINEVGIWTEILNPTFEIIS